MKFKLLFLCVFLINQAVASETEIVGSLTGQGDVDSAGSFSYSMNLSLPTSINNFIPQLSINYSGQKQDGSLGVGWFVDGLSSISRCQGIDNDPLRDKTTAEIINYEVSQSGANAKAFEFSDFCLDGKRLILINGQTNSPPEFRLENDDFARITLKTNQKGNIEKFIVNQKDGTVNEYEKTIKINEKNSSNQYVDKISGVDLPYIWGLTKRTDINGNYWTVEYLDSLKTDVLYPKYIKYTGNSNGVQPSNIITFDYINRVDNEKRFNYFDGSTIILDKKLSKISMSVNGVVKGEYNFNYEEVGFRENEEISKVRLKNIKFCSVNGDNKSCVKPTNFIWTSYNRSYIDEPNLLSAGALKSYNNEKVNFIRLNSKKNSKEKNLFALNQDSNNNISIKDYQIVNNLNVLKRQILLSNNIKKLIEWTPLIKDINDDEIDDLIIYGRDINNNISLLEFTSFFDEENNRQFKFYKQIDNILNIDIPLSNSFWVDGDKNGINDLILTYDDVNNNKLSFYVFKMDISGGITQTYKNTISPDSLKSINDLRSKNVPAQLLVGRFSSKEPLTGLLTYNNSTNSNEQRICTFSIIGKNGYINNNSQSCNVSGLYTKENNLGTDWTNQKFLVVDYNQDGYDDLIRIAQVREGSTKEQATKFWDELVPFLSKGDGTFDIQKFTKTEPYFVDTRAWNTTSIGQWSFPVLGDFNQDGLIDYYRYSQQDEKVNFIGFIQESNNKFQSYSYLMDKWAHVTDPSISRLYLSLGLPADISTNPQNTNAYKLNFFSEPSLDYNSTGNPSIAFNIYAIPYSNSTDGYFYSFLAKIKPQQVVDDPKDLLRTVVHGDGNNVGISYSNIISSPDSLIKNTFPIRNFTKPMLVVSSLGYGWRPEGAAPDSELNKILEINQFSYSLPRIDVKNGRNLGFENKTQLKQGNQFLKIDTTYNQVYPFIGMPKSIIIKAALNGPSAGFDTLVSKTTINDTDFVSDSAYPNTQIKFPRIIKSTTENYESGNLISKIANSQTQEKLFGRITESNIITSSPNGAEVYNTTFQATYYPDDLTNWKAGQVKESTSMSSRTGQTTVQKKQAYEYNSRGLLSKQINDPDDISLKIQNDYEYDIYGNLTSATVTGIGNGTDTNIGTRKVTYAYEAGTNHPAGVFKTKETNLLGHENKYTYDAATGRILTHTDVNGLVASTTLDEMGRVIKLITPENIVNTNSYEACKTFDSFGSNTLGCELGEIYKTITSSTGNTPVITFKNAYGQTTRTMTKAYDNTNYIVTRNEYSDTGRLIRSSEPALNNSAYANLQWTTFQYDGLNRLIKTILPGNRISTVEIAGLTTTDTNAKGLKRVEKKNIAGEVVEIIDHDNNSLKY
ncbi:RHS repeat protein, partial [Acinetobacter seifertii]